MISIAKIIADGVVAGKMLVYTHWVSAIGVVYYESMTVRERVSKLVTSMQGNLWYALTFFLMAVVSVGMLGYQYWPNANQVWVARADAVDLYIAWIFLVDFFAGFFFNPTYSQARSWRTNALDLISSLPISSNLAQALRILRVVRALRVIGTAMDLLSTKNRLEKAKR